MRELEKALTELGKKAGFAALTGSLRDASRPIIKDARKRAPRDSGKLAKGIRNQVFRGKGKSNSVATLHIGFHRRTAWYGQILERGAKRHEIKNRPSSKKKGLSLGADLVRGRVNHPGTKAYPMLKGSFDAKHKEALKILQTRLRQRVIIETIKKYGKAA
uniref:hypothetical protein n=1 Tax=Ningiella ruwaisensis TaxID=2364274 RepID=UPI00144656E0|nr:hypothetical protein [Ningiella ruwaisensis]